jgi:hypothetical protein
MNWHTIALFFKILIMGAPHGNEGKLDKEKITVQRITHLPKVINESSGLAYDSSRSVFYSINDSGGEPKVYITDTLFQLKDSIILSSIKNFDWEEIVYHNDTLVIGDMGNNKNKRKNLCIHTYDLLQQNLQSIPYAYQDQQKFPPDTLDYDCEAITYVEGVYYLISKNRSKNDAHVYTLDVTQNIAHRLVDLPIKGLVTAVSVVKIKEGVYKWAVLSYGVLYFVEQKISATHLSQWTVLSYKKIGYTGQAEAIAWKNNRVLFLTNERGKVWKLQLKN